MRFSQHCTSPCGATKLKMMSLGHDNRVVEKVRLGDEMLPEVMNILFKDHATNENVRRMRQSAIEVFDELTR